MVLKDLAPYVTKSHVPFKDEWVDNNCLAQLKERDRLHSLLIYPNDDELHREFKDAQNLARQLINQARSTYIQAGLKEDQHAPRKYSSRLKPINAW